MGGPPGSAPCPYTALIRFRVTASDPDADAITALTADLSALPAGNNAVFTPNASKSSGTLTWTPTSADGGRNFNIVFTAANALSVSAPTTISVDRYPVMAAPATVAGSEGTPVSVNVTASDLDGQPM